MTKDTNIKKLYTFTLEDYNATLHGMFVANEEDVNNAIGKMIEIGDIYEELSCNMIDEVPVNKAIIDAILEATNNEISPGTIFGYNPMHYIEK
jgi:hypothetical protein